MTRGDLEAWLDPMVGYGLLLLPARLASNVRAGLAESGPLLAELARAGWVVQVDDEDEPMCEGWCPDARAAVALYLDAEPIVSEPSFEQIRAAVVALCADAGVWLGIPA